MRQTRPAFQGRRPGGQAYHVQDDKVAANKTGGFFGRRSKARDRTNTGGSGKKNLDR
jgi:hypothetical protein